MVVAEFKLWQSESRVYINPELVRCLISNPHQPNMTTVYFEREHAVNVEGTPEDVRKRLGA